MSNLITSVTIDTTGWSAEKFSEFAEWLKMFNEYQPGQETCYSLKAEVSESNLDSSETQPDIPDEVQADLEVVKTQLDEVNDITQRQKVENLTDHFTENPDEALVVAAQVLVQVYGDSFNKFFRRFVQKTQAELTEKTKSHDSANTMIKALNELKGGVSLSEVSREVMQDLVGVLLLSRRESGLSILLEEDYQYLEIAVKEAA
jgi:hypothetical protein